MTGPSTLSYTGAVQTVTVPADATVATIECWGGAATNGRGALGGYAKGSLSVRPGDTLYVYVAGRDPHSTSGWQNASDVRVGGTDLSNRVIVAGGSGVQGYNPPANTSGSNPKGGDGGGLTGGTGAGELGSTGASGGTQTNGGGGGNPGSLGYGGATVLGDSGASGAGGDGYYGGGGCGVITYYQSSSNPVYGGGGGGSSYVGTLSATTTSSAVTSPSGDGTGQVTITWSNTAPTAPTPLTPSSGVSVLNPPTVTWQFNDPDVGDAQSKADIQYKPSGGSFTTITGAASTASSYTFGAGVLTSGNTYEWQVRTYDAIGTVSPWSASSFFTVVDQPPAPTITVPGSGDTLTATPATVTWTPPAGYTQTGYQVRRTDGGSTVYYDSGNVTSTATTALVPLDATYGRTDHLQVRVLTAEAPGVWSAWADVSVVSDAGPPQTPLLIVTQPDADAPVVLVRIQNPIQGAGYSAAVSNDLYRTGPDGQRVRIAAGLAVNTTFTDRLPGVGVNTYQAVAYAANGATSPLT